MDCNIIKKNVDVCAAAYENYSEEKIDLDIIIPDYMPSAAKVLRCDVCPSVTSSTVADDRLTLEGVCRINVIYIDEENGKPCAVSENASFSQSQPVHDQLGVYRVIEKLRNVNVNCRLMNPRRIGIKAVVGIAAKVIGNKPREIIAGVEDCDIETLFESIGVCSLAASGEADVRINGETAVSDSPGEVLKSDGCASITDMKVLNDKVLVKGEASVTVLYVGESLGSAELNIPFSEVIDCIGAEENSQASAECRITGIRVSLNGGGVISVEADVKASASVYKNDTVDLLTDAYSKSTELETETAVLTFESLAQDMTFSETVKGAVSVDREDARIAEIFVDPVIKNLSSAGGSLLIEGDMSVGIYAEAGDGYLFSDRSVPFSVSKSFDGGGNELRCEASVCALNVSFSMPDDKTIEIRAELGFELLVFLREKHRFLESLSVKDDCEKIDFGSRFIVYYADRDETLWDVAKKFKTSVGVLMRDNPEAEKENGQERMLLVSGS